MGGGGWGGYASRLFLLFSFPCSADHEQDWPPCKVVFFWLATNTLNVRNSSNNNNNNNCYYRAVYNVRVAKERPDATKVQQSPGR